MDQIVPADTQIEAVYMLAEAYVTWMVSAIREHYPELDLRAFTAAHAYDDLRQKFPGEHVPPSGRLYVALSEGEPGGMVALGKLSESVCEMRTLFVRPEMRGRGLGRRLVDTLLHEARQIGYTHMRLDTLGFMEDALRLYRSLGFADIAPYGDVPAMLRPYIRFLELDLRRPGPQETGG